MGMSNEYQRAHRAVASARGKAREHSCVRCGGPAIEWAYQHTDPEAVRDDRGLLYSTSTTAYEPMCRPCHHKFDVEHETEEERSARVEHMRWVQTQRGGYGSAAHQEAARGNAEKARAKIDRTDPVYLEQMRAAGRKAASVRRRCTCGKESTRSGIGTHQKMTGHKGYVDMERYGK